MLGPAPSWLVAWICNCSSYREAMGNNSSKLGNFTDAATR